MVARVCVLGNAGTYNNQWMVLDATKIKVGAPLPPADVLWIAEQVPGLVATMDVTSVLADLGYWPSYNVAYIPQIYNWSGYPANRSAGFDEGLLLLSLTILVYTENPYEYNEL
jgi:hypothetical protein